MNPIPLEFLAASPLHASAKRWIEEAEPGGSTKAVSQKIVERFRAKGYSFAGTAYSITTGHGEFEHEGPPMESAEGARGFQRPSVNLRSNRQLLSVRVTADGFIYTKPVPPPPGAGGTAYSPLGGVARQEQRRRPGDDRDDWRSPSSSGSTASDPAPGVPRGLLALRETEMHGFPWSAIGHVTPQCSGALIAPNKVCVAAIRLDQRS